MKFAVFTSLLAVFSGLVSSVPVADVEASGLEARATAPIYPNLIVEIYSPDGGYQSSSVYVSRYTYQGTQYDTNALLAFPFPSGYGGKTCSFQFSGGWYAGGTRKIQLFSVIGEITPSNTFTSRPSRNLPYGIFTISEDGTTGTWDDVPTPPTFPCPTSASVLGFEVVPQGDADYASWDGGAGLAIVVL